MALPTISRHWLLRRLGTTHTATHTRATLAHTIQQPHRTVVNQQKVADRARDVLSNLTTDPTHQLADRQLQYERLKRAFQFRKQSYEFQRDIETKVAISSGLPAHLLPHHAVAAAESDKPSRSERRRTNKARKREEKLSTVYSVPPYLTVERLSDILHVKLLQLHLCGRKQFPSWWPMLTKRQLQRKNGFSTIRSMVIQYETAAKLAEVLKLRCEVMAELDGSDLLPSDRVSKQQTAAAASNTTSWLQPTAPTSSLRMRQPVISITGHKDHGKTTLLDTLRQGSTAKYETGGITQELYSHILTFPPLPTDGAATNSSAPTHYTFLDTPGHHTFSAMRRTAAWFADVNLVVISCAPDEGLQPQSIEALETARKLVKQAATIVVLNKTDLPDNIADKVRRELQDEHSIRLVDWNYRFNKYSDTSRTFPTVEISAKTGNNLDKLQQAIQLSIQQRIDLLTDFDAVPSGAVLESFMESHGRGNVLRVILQVGTLRTGDSFVSGHFHGRVVEIRTKRLGEIVDHIEPGVVCEIMGCGGLPTPGSDFFVCSSERAEQISAYRQAEELFLLQKQEREALIEQKREAKRLRLLERENRAAEAARIATELKNNPMYRTIEEERKAASYDEVYEPSAGVADEVYDDADADEMEAVQGVFSDVYEDADEVEDDLSEADLALLDEQDSINLGADLDDSDANQLPVQYNNIQEIKRAEQQQLHLDNSARTLLIKSSHTGGARMFVDALQEIDDKLKHEAADNAIAYGIRALKVDSGSLSKNDIMLAAPDQSPIFLFRTTKPSSEDTRLASEVGVTLRHYKHFEDLLRDVEHYGRTGKLPAKAKNRRHA